MASISLPRRLPMKADHQVVDQEEKEKGLENDHSISKQARGHGENRNDQQAHDNNVATDEMLHIFLRKHPVQEYHSDKGRQGSCRSTPS